MKNKIVSIFLVFLFVFLLFSNNIFAGGGPGFYCKQLSLKQGWLLDRVKDGGTLSESACIIREQTQDEKDEILRFCNQDINSASKDECLDKCNVYLTADKNLNKCIATEVANIQLISYLDDIDSFLNSGSLVSTITIVLFVLLVIWTFSTFLKKTKVFKK